MKKTSALLVSTIISLVFLMPSWSIDKETLRNMMNNPVSTGGMRQMEAAAWPNISLVEEILFFSDMKEDNGTARDNGLAILRRSAEEGVNYTKERYFDTLLRLYNQATTVVHPTDLEDTKKMIKAQLASFGLVSSTRPLSFSFSSFPSLANSMSIAGFIKNQGILNSLNQKISNAKDILDKKGPDAKNTAINKIQAAINELDAQRGNHITEDGYQILSGCCKNLITKIQSTNP